MSSRKKKSKIDDLNSLKKREKLDDEMQINLR